MMRRALVLALAGAVLLGAGSASAADPATPEAAGVEPAPAPPPAATPPAAAPPEPDAPLVLRPYLVVVGGLNYDGIVNRPAVPGMSPDERQSRVTTIGLTRFGLEGVSLPHVSVRSELELNAGPHGASVWEGQAAITVRDQFLGLSFGDLRLQVGRITDPASIDYYSTHVANLLLTDFQLRMPFLASGANRGHGVALRWEAWPGLRLGFTFNAGNPVSNTGVAALGGTYPPFSRFYFNIIATVRESATRLPSDLFHAALASPSLQWEGPWLRAQISYQYLVVDVTTADADNPLIHGHNFRGGVEGRLAGGRVRPFVNASYITNEIIASNGSLPDTSMLSEDLFHGYTFGLGLDVALDGRSGVGGQVNTIVEQQGDGAVFGNHFVNVGGSWWFHPQVALGARYSLFLRCQDQRAGGCADLLEHQHNFYLTFLGSFGGEPARGSGLF